MIINEKRDWLVFWLFVAILGIGFVCGLKVKGCASTEINFSFVGESCYSKIANFSPVWDKSVETWGQNLEIWNEIYFTLPIIYGYDRKKGDLPLSIDTRYKVDLSNGNYRGILTFDYTKAINKFWTIEGGAGVYWKNNQVYFSPMFRNTVLFDITIFNVRMDNYLYLPIPAEIEMRNDLRLKLNIFITYFSLLSRQEFRENQFSTFNAGCLEVKF